MTSSTELNSKPAASGEPSVEQITSLVNLTKSIHILI